MTGKRNIGNVAAIGGMTAAVVLLTGLATAKADEMADLRANQLLLQQRIDQLAQATKQYPGQTGASAYGNVAAPTAPSLGGSFPRSFLIPGTDTSVRVGGFVDLTILDFLQGGGNVNGSNYGSNSGQNGNLQSLPLAGGFVPGVGFVNPNATARAPGRNNGVLEFSPQQSRFNIETRTPTSWGEARTFFEWDWAGCNNFSCQDVAQSGNNQLTRLRFAYGTLGGFLGGQAISNFSDADADTESMEFGGAMGSTGGQRIPQVRYTIAGPYGSAFSVSAENPWTTVITPGGVQASDSGSVRATGSCTTPAGTAIGPICNGQPCTGAGGAQANPAVAKAPNLTFASYWSQPWGHMDFAGILRFYQLQDGGFMDRQYIGYGGHISGDVHPNWFGYTKDDILFSFIVGNAIGSYASGGSTSFYPLATNFSVKTAVRHTAAGLRWRTGVVEHPYPAGPCVQRERRHSALVDADPADDRSRGHRPAVRLLAADRTDPGAEREPATGQRFRQSGVEPGRVHHHRRRVHVWPAHRRRQPQGPRECADRQVPRRFLKRRAILDPTPAGSAGGCFVCAPGAACSTGQAPSTDVLARARLSGSGNAVAQLRPDPQPTLVMPVLVTVSTSSAAEAGSVDAHGSSPWAEGPRNGSTAVRFRILVNLAVVVKHQYPVAGLDPWAVSPRTLFRGHPRLFPARPPIARRGRPGRARPRGRMCFEAFEDHRKSEPDSRGAGPVMTISGCAGDTPVSHFHSTTLNRTAVGEAASQGSLRGGAHKPYATSRTTLRSQDTAGSPSWSRCHNPMISKGGDG